MLQSLSFNSYRGFDKNYQSKEHLKKRLQFFAVFYRLPLCESKEFISPRKSLDYKNDTLRNQEGNVGSLAMQSKLKENEWKSGVRNKEFFEIRNVTVDFCIYYIIADALFLQLYMLLFIVVIYEQI